MRQYRTMFTRDKAPASTKHLVRRRSGNVRDGRRQSAASRTRTIRQSETARPSTGAVILATGRPVRVTGQQIPEAPRSHRAPAPWAGGHAGSEPREVSANRRRRFVGQAIPRAIARASKARFRTVAGHGQLSDQSHEKELENRDEPVHDASQTLHGWIATTRTDQTSDCQRSSANLLVLVPKTFVVNSLR